MVRKDKEEVRSSTSAVYVRPRFQLGEKHHQIRAYILLIQVIEVRHLVRGFFPTTPCSTISTVLMSRARHQEKYHRKKDITQGASLM